MRGRVSIIAGLGLILGCADAKPESPTALRIFPASGPNNRATSVTISGRIAMYRTEVAWTSGRATSEFQTAAWLDETPLTNVSVNVDGTISAEVPTGLDLGVYPLKVTDAFGQTGQLLEAFTVLQGTCATISTSTTGCPNACDADPGCQCAGSQCQPLCGDGILRDDEQCDDGNLDSDDGCSASCIIEVGWICPPGSDCQPLCGDAVTIGSETCDDGNEISQDGCTSCQLEPGWQCDVLPCTPICGDGMLLTLEDCDDGNLTNDDGCSDQCTVDDGFTCTGNPSICTPDVPADWWNGDWAARIPVTVDPTELLDVLLNVPILVILDSDQVQRVGSPDSLRFIFAADDRELAYDVDHWAPDSAHIWVQWPRLDPADGDSQAWMYFDNPNAGLAASTDVWSAYAGVWHLGDPLTGPVRDASPSAKDGVARNFDADAVISGVIGGAYRFDGVDSYIFINSAPPPDPLAITGDTITMEGWVQNTGSTGDWKGIVSRQFGTDTADTYFLGTRFSDDTLPALVASPAFLGPAGAVERDEWVYLVGVRSGDNFRLYKDGQLLDSGNLTDPGDIAIDDNPVIIGGQENDPTDFVNHIWLGALDEIRLSRQALSDAWIDAQYRTMMEQLVTLGPPETL